MARICEARMVSNGCEVDGYGVLLFQKWIVGRSLFNKLVEPYY